LFHREEAEVNIIGGSPEGRLRLFLWLVALHSFVVGILLIVLPARAFPAFGYGPIGDAFFKVQGGVFHLVMVFGYAGGARRPADNQPLIVFAIAAKGLATLFLLSYFIFADRLLVVLLSGIGDGVMGALILFLNRAFKAGHSGIS
jgi:hypothetical protein